MLKRLKRLVLWATAIVVGLGVLWLARPWITDRLGGSLDAIDAKRFQSQPAWSGQLSGSEQVVLVMVPTGETSKAIVMAYERAGAGPWKSAAGPYSARIGTRGFIAADQRTEKSETTPIGVYELTGAFGNLPLERQIRLPYDVLGNPADCWISDPADSAYNRWVLREPCEPPNVRLVDRKDGIFQAGIIFDFNTVDRVANRGSALFIHTATVADGTMQPTYGGVALARDDVLRLMNWLDPAANPKILMGPESEFPVAGSDGSSAEG